MRREIAERLDALSIPEPNSGCRLWLGLVSEKGYGLIAVRVEGKWRNRRAHRMSWEANRGPIPAGLFVCHKCDVPSCVNPDHLWLGTNADNSVDRDLKGRTLRGERVGSAKLTPTLIVEIRRSSESGASLAGRYNVTRSVIHKARRGATWAHVDAA